MMEAGRKTFSETLSEVLLGIKFEELEDSIQKTLAVHQLVRFYYAKKQGIKQQDIKVQKVVKDNSSTPNSVQVTISVPASCQLLQEKKPCYQPKEILPFFQALKLTPLDFDIRGDKQFLSVQSGGQVKTRGGFPYFPALEGKRWGLNVWGLYDNGNNNWLGRDGSVGEWVTFYHGIRYPANADQPGQEPVLKNIMNGRKNGKMMRAGKAQGCQNHETANLSGQKVGKGIYGSPHLQTAIAYSQLANSGGQQFHVVLQCRVRPQSIKISKSSPDVWVINDSKNIRPYGIILFTREQFKKIQQKGNNIYNGKAFSWEGYKQQYNDFRKKHNLVPVA